MVSVCKTVTDPSRKIITKCGCPNEVIPKLTKPRQEYLHEQIRKKYKHARIYTNRAQQSHEKQERRDLYLSWSQEEAHRGIPPLGLKP